MSTGLSTGEKAEPRLGLFPAAASLGGPFPAGCWGDTALMPRGAAAEHLVQLLRAQNLKEAVAEQTNKMRNQEAFFKKVYSSFVKRNVKTGWPRALYKKHTTMHNKKTNTTIFILGFKLIYVHVYSY